MSENIGAGSLISGIFQDLEMAVENFFTRGYFAMVVCAAWNILTPPVSSWRIRPFCGSIPMQFPVNFLPLKITVILWFN